MTSKSPLQKARKWLAAGKYPKIISLLEPLVLEYRESFDFFFLLGTACLYVEDIGGAEAYYIEFKTIIKMRLITDKMTTRFLEQKFPKEKRISEEEKRKAVEDWKKNLLKRQKLMIYPMP